MKYDAFISYNYAADAQLASAVARGLERFARPWRRLRALRVFRDETDLSVNPDLWSPVEDAIGQSSWFVLLCSPAAAQSAWVGREVATWLQTGSADRVLLVLTDGQLMWDADQGAFGARSDAIPPGLRGAFTAEPRYLDLRWAKTHDHLGLEDAQFREAIRDLAAPIHGREKLELESEDLRQFHRARRTRVTAAVLLVALTLLSTGAGLAARRSAQRSNANARRALRAQLASTARNLASTIDGTRLASQLAMQAALLGDPDDPDARAAMLATLQAAPAGVVRTERIPESIDVSLVVSPDRERFGVSVDTQPRAYVGSRAGTLSEAVPGTAIAVGDDGALVVERGDRAVYWRKGEEIPLGTETPVAATILPGHVVVATYDRLEVFALQRSTAVLVAKADVGYEPAALAPGAAGEVVVAGYRIGPKRMAVTVDWLNIADLRVVRHVASDVRMRNAVTDVLGSTRITDLRASSPGSVAMTIAAELSVGDGSSQDVSFAFGSARGRPGLVVMSTAGGSLSGAFVQATSSVGSYVVEPAAYGAAAMLVTRDGTRIPTEVPQDVDQVRFLGANDDELVSATHGGLVAVVRVGSRALGLAAPVSSFSLDARGPLFDHVFSPDFDVMIAEVESGAYLVRVPSSRLW